MTLAGTAGVLFGFWGLIRYCGVTFISDSPYCSEEGEFLFVALILMGIVIAPTALIVLIWRLLRSLR